MPAGVSASLCIIMWPADRHCTAPPSAPLSQSCIAMLAEPGGLYLDVKSGYSTAKQLKWFVSTLAGIGVHVKVGARACRGVRRERPFGSEAGLH